MRESRLPDDTELRRLYVDENFTMEEIARLVGVSRQRVQQRLKYKDIARPRPEIDRDRLEKLYVQEGRSLRHIGGIFGVSPSFVRSELQRLDIPLHGLKRYRFDQHLLYKLYVTDGMLMSEIAKKLGCSVSTVENEIIRNGITDRHPTAARRTPKFTHEELHGLYIEEGLSVQQIAERGGCVAETIRYWLVKHGIPRRQYRKTK